MAYICNCHELRFYFIDCQNNVFAADTSTHKSSTIVAKFFWHWVGKSLIDWRINHYRYLKKSNNYFLYIFLTQKYQNRKYGTFFTIRNKRNNFWFLEIETDKYIYILKYFQWQLFLKFSVITYMKFECVLSNLFAAFNLYWVFHVAYKFTYGA